MSTPRLTEIFERAKDVFTGAIGVMQNDHRYIHEGKGFTYAGNTGSVSAAGTYALSITTPPKSSNKYIHFRPANFTATANTTSITIREDDTTASGSAGTPINMNRNSDKASSITLAYGVTAGGGGTIIYQDAVGGGSNPANAKGGVAGAADERVLKPNTVYTIIFTVVGAVTASTCYYSLFWYEEDEGK